MTQFSIVILKYNKVQFLKRCLHSLIENLGKNDEIIIVDNKPTIKIDPQWKKNRCITIIENNKNIGIAAGRNIGLKRAKGKYVIFLDDDAYITKSLLPKIKTFLDREKKVGIVGPKIL